MATVTLTLDEHNALIRAKNEAENRAAELHTQLMEAQMTSSKLTPILVEGFLCSYELVRFLIAHGHPEVVKSQPWPFEALIGFAAVLEQLPATPEATAHHKEAAMDMRDMAKEAAHWNSVRAARKLALLRGDVAAANALPAEPEPKPS